MGCWNGTCGISQLPIHAGDDVMIYFIVENRYKEGGADYCYPTGYWNPIGFPFKAKYNDYGSFEDEDLNDSYLKFNLDYIKRNLVELEQGKNQYHDIAVKKDIFDIDLVKNAIHEGRLSIYQHKLEDGPGDSYRNVLAPHFVGQFMIHYDIWDTFSKYNGEKWAKKRFDERFKRLRKENQKLKKNLDDEYMIGVGWHLSTEFGSEFTSSHRGIQEFYDDKKIMEEGDFDILHRMLCFDGSMGVLRKGYSPQPGAGSQSEGYETFRKLGKSMEKVMKKWEKYVSE